MDVGNDSLTEVVSNSSLFSRVLFTEEFNPGGSDLQIVDICKFESGNHS